MLYKESLAKVLESKVGFLNNKTVTKGLLRPIGDALKDMEKGYVKPDDEAYSEEQKSRMPCLIPESTNPDRSSGAKPIPTPFLLIDVDGHKHEEPSVRDELNSKIFEVAQTMDNYICGWVSATCGTNLLFWVPVDNDPLMAKSQPDLHRSSLEATAATIEHKLSSAIGISISADKAFFKTINGLKQLKYLPRRKLHWNPRPELSFDTKEMWSVRPKEEQKPKAKPIPVPDFSTDDDATPELWQSSLSRVLEANIYDPIRNASEGGRNNLATTNAWQFGLFKYGYETQAGIEWWAEQEEKLMDLIIDNCVGGFPSEDACRKRVEQKIEEGCQYAEKNPSAVKDVTPDHPKRKPVFTSVYDGFIPPSNEQQAVKPEPTLLDLNKKQPESTYTWPEDKLATLLYKSFIALYRKDASEPLHEKCWNIKTRVQLSGPQTKELLNKKWVCVAKKGDDEQMSATCIQSALLNTSLDIHGTNYYTMPIKSYYYKSGYVGFRNGTEIFNTRGKLALEDTDPAQLTNESPEADLLMELIKNRFNQEGKGDLYAAFYCKYICQMVMEPDKKPGTAIAFLCHDGGTGKTFLGQNLPQLFLNDPSTGDIHTAVVDKLNENRTFAYGFEDKLCVFFDEANMSVGTFNSLKRMITDAQITVEKKGKDPVAVENCLRFFLASNNVDFFNIKDSEDRRWSVFKLDVPMPQEGEEGYKEVGYVMSYVNSLNRANIPIDMENLKRALFKKIFDFYKKYEAETGKELNIGRALQTEFKEELATDYLSKNPVIATALTLISSSDANSPISLVKSKFCVSVQNELLRNHEKAGKLTPRIIARQLLDSKLFDEYVQGHHPSCIYLTNHGISVLDEGGFGGYRENLNKLRCDLRGEYKLPDFILKPIEDIVAKEQKMAEDEAKGVLNLANYVTEPGASSKAYENYRRSING